MTKDKKKKEKKGLSRTQTKAFSSILAVIIGLLIGLIIILITNPENAGAAIPRFLKGPFNRGRVGFGDLFYHMTPILMTGLSVGFGYKTGLFNIGASGQFLVGGFVAILSGHYLEGIIPTGTIWIVSMLLAALAASLMGALIGALKAYRNVNEVITSIMLNYSAMYIVNDLIKRLGIYNQMKNNTIPIAAKVPKMGLDALFPGTIAGGSIIIAIIFVIVLHIILHKTTFGYELKSVGLNRYASKYAGINENRSIILSMAIAGGLAGIGGAMLYLSGAGNHLTVQEIIPQEGFDGIAIALLGLNEPIGIFLSTMLIAYLQMGGQAIQTLGYTSELVSMIISIILYISALSVLFSTILNKFNKNKNKVDRNVIFEPLELKVKEEDK